METASADQVLLSAARLAMALSVHAADEVGGVSTVQLRALTLMGDRVGGMNLVQLADQLGVAVSTASRLVDRLVAAGLVDRRPSPRTRREIRLSLTRSGRATVARYDKLRLAGLRACLDHVPADERDGVIEALRALVAAGCEPPAGGADVPASR